MALGLLGRKVGMTQVFGDGGEMIPVTVIQAGPCHVLQIRTKERDGYEAVQVGFLDKPRRLASRSERGHVTKLDGKRAKRRGAAGGEEAAKADCEPKRLVKEFRDKKGGLNIADYKIGQAITVESFKDVKSVDVTGVTKGRGTAGVMVRHNFQGQRATHGTKKVHRHAGSTGCNTWPARTFKGRRMAGRYGAEKSTMRNIKLVRIDAENNLLLVRGAVPGFNGGYVSISAANMLR
jgi:large subunit ribosomal protein L3